MGKSSLMVRTAARLREHGIRVVTLDLTALGANVTAEQWTLPLSVAFSPDGNTLASMDGMTVRLWRAAGFAETDAPSGARAPHR